MLYFFPFPESILERKLDCILPGWGYIHPSSSHRPSSGSSCFFTDAQPSRRISPGKSRRKEMPQFPESVVWSFIPGASSLHAPPSEVSPSVLPSSLPVHVTCLQRDLGVTDSGNRGSEPGWVRPSFPGQALLQDQGLIGQEEGNWQKRNHVGEKRFPTHFHDFFPPVSQTIQGRKS